MASSSGSNRSGGEATAGAAFWVSQFEARFGIVAGESGHGRQNGAGPLEAFKRHHHAWPLRAQRRRFDDGGSGCDDEGIENPAQSSKLGVQVRFYR